MKEESLLLLSDLQKLINQVVLIDYIIIILGGVFMIIKINTLSQIPLYLQLRNQIVKGIGKGELTEGESLPTVRQMAADLGINTMTVSKAYQLLKNEGFLYTDRRLGSIVHIPENEEPSSLFQEKLEDELELLSAEARIRGMNLEDFLSLCSKVFVEMEVAVE